MDTLLEPSVEFNEGTDDMDFNLDWKDGFVDTPVLPQTISSANPLAAWNSFATTNPGPSVHGKGSKSTPNNKSQNTKLPKGKRKKQSPTATSNESPGDPNALSGGLGPTRIRRQYNCESCSFRTINPREFLYHRRDFHGAKVKIVECPYCVYACQYFQKLQRHILLVHKLETVTTPPPSVSSTNCSSHGNHQQNSQDCKKGQAPLGDAAFDVNSTSSKAASSKQVIKKSHPATSSNQTILKSHPFHENDDDDTADHGLVMDESDVDEMNAIDDIDDPLENLVEVNAIFEDRPEGQVIKCRKCGYATDVKALFKAHVSDHSAPKNKCDQCNFESAYAYIVKQHAEKEHSSSSSSSSKNLLQNESAQNTSHFSNNNSTFTCSKCAFTTDSPQLHSQHVARCTHLRDPIEDEDNNFSPADSSKIVDDNSEAIASTSEAPLGSKGKCSTQNLTMRSGTVNIIQTPGCKEATVKLLHCAYCEFTHKESKSMVSHLSIHTGRKPYKCRLCEFSSNWKEVVARHAKSRHNGSNFDVEQLFKYTVNKFICRVVDETGDLNLGPEVTFPEDIKLRELEEESSAGPSQANSPSANDEELSLSVHTASAVSSAVAQRSAYGYSGFKGQFKCDFCPFRAEKAFHIDFHLKRHTQTEGADFKCPHCPYWVNAKKSLTRHIYLHDCENGTAVPPDELDDDDTDQATENVTSAIDSLPVNSTGTSNSISNLNHNSSGGKNNINTNSGQFVTNGDHCSYTNNQNSSSQLEVALSVPASAAANAASSSLLNKRASARNRCDACPFVAGTKTQLLYHKQFHRPNRVAPYKCPHCTYTVSHQHLLNQHLKVHFRMSTDGSFSSSTSNCELENSLALNHGQMVNDDYSQGDGAYNYNSSNNNNNNNNINSNSSNNVSNNKRIFQCNYCPTKSKSKNYIIVHQQQHEASNSPNDTCHKCYLCNFMTLTKKIFLKHLDAHTLDEENERKDDEQNESYIYQSSHEPPPSKRMRQNNSSSNSHGIMDVIPDSNNKSIPCSSSPSLTFSCSHCPAAFKSHGDLKLHTVFHTIDSPYPCDSCTFKAHDEQHLIKHKTVHTQKYANKKRADSFLHSTNQTPPLSPDSSSVASFSIDFDLSNLDLSNIRPSLVEKIRFHVQQLCLIEKHETEEYLQKIKTRSKHRFIFKCNLCPASFAKNFSLKFHTTLHGYDGAVTCNLCNYAVDFEENLKAHQQLHSNSTLASSSVLYSYNHKCTRCPAAFSKPSRLEKHLSLHGSGAKWMCDKCDYAVPYAATLVKHRHVHETDVDFETVSPTDSHPLSNSTQQLIPLSVLPENVLISAADASNQAKNSPRPGCSVGGEKTLFLCDRCPYSHPRRDAVLSHEKRHEQERCVRDGKKCPHCDYVCLQPSYLREHIRLHFEPANGRQPRLYRSFDDIELWAQVIGENEKNLLFKDLGKEKELKDRFEPQVKDEDFLDLYKNLDTLNTSDGGVDDDEAHEEDVEAGAEVDPDEELEKQLAISNGYNGDDGDDKSQASPSDVGDEEDDDDQEPEEEEESVAENEDREYFENISCEVDFNVNDNYGGCEVSHAEVNDDMDEDEDI